MSVPLKDFTGRLPGLADIPVTLYNGIPLSISEVNDPSKLGAPPETTPESIPFDVQAEKTITDTDYLQTLAVAHYAKRVQKEANLSHSMPLLDHRFRTRIVAFGLPVLTPAEALDNVKKKTDVGLRLLSVYLKLRMEVLNRIA
jgi:hypothetical protein